MKSAIHKLLGALLAAGALLSPPTQADDIDLYTGGEATTGSQANVLIVLDNMAEWARAAEGWPEGKQGVSELESLSEILSTLGDSVNVGLLMGAGSNGGYVRFAVREMNTTNKTAFTGMLNTMVANFGGDGDNDDKVNTASIVYDGMLNAAYRYFNSFARFGTTDLPSGSQADLRDYAGSAVNVTKMPAGALAGNSLSSSTATDYSGPSAANGGCSKNFIIFLGNGYPSQTGTKQQLIDAATLGSVPSTDSNGNAVPDYAEDVSGGDNARVADEWTRLMYTYGVKSTVDDPRSTTTPKAKLINRITTYTIDVCKNSCDGSTPAKTDANREQAILLKSMAKVGGGKYFKSTSKQEIKNAMALIFAEIQAVNSVFASASLPVSVNTQGTFENQIYVGVFRPDGGSRPRWFGNLKEYKIGRFCDRDRNGRVLVDSTRALVNGMIPATLTGNATGPVTGTFSGSIVNAAGVTTAVSGTVSSTISGTARGTLAATFGASAGTTGSPADDLGSGAVTGTITGTGTGSGTSTFTGTLFATPSLSGGYTATDWRIGEDVPAPDCGTDASGKIARLPYFADRNGNRATDDSGGTGFIDLQARSHWSSASSFWAAVPSATAGASDLPDGPEVERGGAAQRLRTTWAATATAPHQDGRKVYTCLGTCLTGGAAADKQLYNSANAVYTTNTAVTTALAAPAGSATVSLVRSGDTVTATSTVAHGFSDGTVTIAGAVPADYNGDKTITVTDATHFTYTQAESPTTTDTATATKPGVTVSVTSIVLSGTTPGTTVTATVTTASPHFLDVGNSTTIAGAAQSFLNGSHTVLSVDALPPLGVVFTFSVTIPGGNPTTPLAGTATIKCGGSASNETATATWDSATGRFTFIKSGTGNYDTYPAGCRNAAVGATVTVSGAADSKYNGSWTVISAGNATVTAGTLAASSAATTPDAGASKTATTAGTSFPINITRAFGSTTAAAVTIPAVAHGFTTTDTIIISGASQSRYNGTFVPSLIPTATSFAFGPITVTPTAPRTDTGPVTATIPSGVAGPDTTNLILWTRGKDLWEDEDLNGAFTNVRASIHADVLHSRPAVVNYGSSIGIVGFYGANDGFLRAIHGGTPSIDGEEKWAFIPSEFMNYNKLSRLYKNSNLVRYPNLACTITPTPTARDYFWDGPITVYQSPDGTASTPPTKTWLFAIMRRGGRSIYALDVTNPDTPKFMWRISNTHFNNTPSATYAELGQTWSEPQIAKLKGTFTRADATVVTDPVVLVFGAGYDAAVEDTPTGSNRAPLTKTMGRGVFVVEAETGQLIQFLAPTTGVTGYSFAADVTVYDRNADGYVDRIYAADTNANVFRFDTDQTVTDVTSSTYWKRYHIAKVGDIDANGGADALKFLFKPEILPFTHGGVVKTMVLVGSGNREKPLNNFTSAGTVNTLPVCLGPASPLYSDTYYSTSTSNKVNDRFFGLLDAVQSGAVEATVNADPIELGDLQQINSNDVTNNTLTPFTLSSGDRGWQILLRNDPDGNGARNEEKTVNAGKVIGGKIFFATNTPVSPNVSAGVCSNLGQALSYALDPLTGMPAFNRDDSTSGGTATYTATDFSTVFVGGGLPPTAVSGTVMVGGEPVNICIGCGGKGNDGTTVFTPTDPSPELTGIRTRLYWSYGAD